MMRAYLEVAENGVAVFQSESCDLDAGRTAVDAGRSESSNRWPGHGWFLSSGATEVRSAEGLLQLDAALLDCVRVVVAVLFLADKLELNIA